LALDSNPEGSQPLVQSGYHGLSDLLQETAVLASIGQKRSFVKFEGEMKH